MKLRNKITLPATVLITLGFLISGTASYTIAKKALLKGIDARLDDVVDSLRLQCGQWMESRFEEMNTMTGNGTQFQRAMGDDYLGRMAKKQVEKNLIDLAEKSDSHSAYFLLDKDGKIVIGQPDILDPIMSSAEPVINAIENGTSSAFSPLFGDADSNTPQMIIGAPVNEKAGDRNSPLVGILLTLISPTPFFEETAGKIEIGKTGYAFLLEAQGKFIFHPREKQKILAEDIRKHEYGKKLMSANGVVTYTFVGHTRRSVVKHESITGWTVGVGMNTKEILAPAARLRFYSILIGLCTIVVIGTVVYLISILSTRPVEKTAAVLKDIAEGEGDLTKRLQITTKDETCEMAHWFNTFMSHLQEIIKSVAENTTALSASAEELSTVSNSMAQEAESLHGEADCAALSSTDLAKQLTTISGGSDEMSSAVSTVAAAIEEMTASLNEVAQNCEKGSAIADEADKKTKAVGDVMNKLGEASGSITRVIEVINDIADQTNLLALNATIEAASAGEAGKGFAVVANEVKQLAKQSAEATQSINSQISDMQNRISQAVESVQEISQVVEEMKHISSSIAAAVEQQSSTTTEISRSVSGANSAAENIATGIGQTDSHSRHISESFEKVRESSQHTASGAVETQASSQELARLSSELEKLVKKFRY